MNIEIIPMSGILSHPRLGSQSGIEHNCYLLHLLFSLRYPCLQMISISDFSNRFRIKIFNQKLKVFEELNASKASLEEISSNLNDELNASRESLEELSLTHNQTVESLLEKIRMSNHFWTGIVSSMILAIQTLKVLSRF